jgi:SAM-dependent methyltransferase
MKSMDKGLVRVCPICGSKTGEVLHHFNFTLPNDSPLPKEYDLVSCMDCGFVFADTPAPQSSYDSYYRSFSIYEDEKVSSGGTGGYDISRQKRMAKDVTRFIMDKRASILDIGCANGGLLIELKKLGYADLCGIDPSKQCVKYVRDNGIPAYEGDIFSMGTSLPDKLYDGVILSHVMEHVRDIRGAMDRITAKMSEGACLYLEVPDASSYSSHYVVPFYFFDSEHINHFDEPSLDNLCGQFGLSSMAHEKKEIGLNGKNYPAVAGIFRKTSKTPISNKIIPDLSSKISVQKYLKMSSKNSRWPEIEKLAGANEEVVVFGAGSFSQRIISQEPFNKLKIIAFVDNNRTKQGSRLMNIPVHPPEYLLKRKGPIIISSALYSGDISEQIRSMGVKDPIYIVH